MRLRHSRNLALLAASCLLLARPLPAQLFNQIPDESRAIYELASVPLWPGAAPQARGETTDDIPRLYPLVAPTTPAPRAAVLVLPGGGYNTLAAHEGFPIAEHFRTAGVAAFVLKYRVRPYAPSVALLDAQRAVRLLRARARDYGIDPARIAVIGFSAGGHLAANLCAQADDGRADAVDPVEHQSCRVQSAMLIYPSLVRANVRAGEQRLPIARVLEFEGLHRAVGARTPPTFLVVGYDDDRTPYEHSLAYAARLHEAGVRFELHVLGTGGHGFALRGRDARLQIWGQLAVHWLQTVKFLPAASAALAAR